MLDMIEDEEPGMRNTQLFADEDNILHRFYSASDHYRRFNTQIIMSFISSFCE